MQTKLVFLVVLFTIVACTKKANTDEASTDVHSGTEKYRPAYHFTPSKNWMNDPNGLVYYEGEYHLFYQHNPFANTWGHMSWGHAVSTDLLHWKHLPVALTEYIDAKTSDSTMIFSGTAVVDTNNSSGLCKSGSCMVAIYTSHVHKDNQAVVQHQSLAYSNDRGRTWTRYDKNPILDIQRKDFRDPKVFWYEPAQKWILTLVVPDLHTVQFYESKNLTQWKQTGSFGSIGDTTKIWECPDLFQLPIDGTSEKRWVLSVSGSHPQGSSFVGMQYFVGTFDGNTFKADDAHQKPLYVNYGKDFYAGIVYNNLPKDSPAVMIGWINNWAYGTSLPTSPWKSAMSIPRELSLHKTAEGVRLFQHAIKEINTLRDAEITELTNMKDQAVELEVVINTQAEDEAGVKIYKSANEETVIGYNSAKAELFIDRTRAGQVDFHKDFSSVEKVALAKVSSVKLHIFIDNGIIEVFVNDGEQSLSDIVFPNGDEYSIESYSKNNTSKVIINAWKMNSVWDK